MWVENVVAKHEGVNNNTAWHLDFGEVCQIIKFSRDTAAANYLQQEADIERAKQS